MRRPGCDRGRLGSGVSVGPRAGMGSAKECDYLQYSTVHRDGHADGDGDGDGAVAGLTDRVVEWSSGRVSRPKGGKGH